MKASNEVLEKELKIFFDNLWKDYSKINPQALQIHNLLEGLGETIENDHIAFRTFNHKKIDISVFAELIEPLGYQRKGEYEFPRKKLKAAHFENSISGTPKIFVSELVLEEFSEGLQSTVADLVDQVSEAKTKTLEFCYSGRPWKMDSATYEKLLDESEYAGWLSAFGFRANHFTLNANAFRSFKTLKDFNEFLKSEGFQLNSSGGEIKGSSAQYLEQSSTLAAKVECQFDDKSLLIPSCYYEFALRYPDQSGKLYQGFIAESADKIFESTNRDLSRSA